MPHVNFEFKARVNGHWPLEKKLASLNPIFKGEDHQIDTYFKVEKGRLKLREGTIENALIYYEREDTNAAKQSDVILYQHHPAKGLKEILTKVHGIKTVVDKKRKIYFVDNVKIHFDEVKDLGTFIEVEAIDEQGTIKVDHLKKQCHFFAELFGIKDNDYLAVSYSDMIPDRR